MDENKILVPYNFKAMDQKAIDFMIQTYAGNERVQITLFHKYAPIPEIILTRNSVMEKMSDNMHYLRKLVLEQEDRMVDVKQHLLDSGFKNDQVNYIYLPQKGDLASEIILLVRNHGYNTLILNRSGSVTGFFKASVSNKIVTTLKNVNITIIT